MRIILKSHELIDSNDAYNNGRPILIFARLLNKRNASQCKGGETHHTHDVEGAELVAFELVVQIPLIVFG